MSGLKNTQQLCLRQRNFTFVCLTHNLFIVLLGQEAAFRKVVQATMVRDRQHGPVVELNRIQVDQMHPFEHLFHNLFFSLSSLFLSLGVCVPDRLQSL